MSIDETSHEYRYGQLRLHARPDEDFVFYATFIAGEWDYLRPRPGDVVLDAGANVGDFTLKAARAVGRAGLVLAIEPDRRLLPYLEYNLRSNSISNVRILDCALGKPGDGFLVSGPDGSSVRSFIQSEADGQPVAVLSLDQVAARAGVDHVDIIKMDIEGKEYESLAGYSDIDSVRQLAVELHGRENLLGVPELIRNRFLLSYQSAHDIWFRTVHNSLRHPVQFAMNELVSRFVALSGLKTRLMSGRNPVPSVSGHDELAILYATNRSVDTQRGGRHPHLRHEASPET